MNSVTTISDPDMRNSAVSRGVEVVQIEAQALAELADALKDPLADAFAQACSALLTVSGRVVVTGMGKSGHIGRKWAATFAATGTPASYVHPAEAAHGDLGMLVSGDVLVVISNSGNTRELSAFLRYANDIGAPVIGVASRDDSMVIQNATIKLVLPPTREACHANIAPTTSTTVQLALGDALAMAVMDLRGFSKEGMKVLHPGGSIGLRLTPVREMMHSKGLPLVQSGTPMRDVLVEMTRSGFGIAGVVDDEGALIGVITDGDLRRHFDIILDATAGQVMTSAPRVIDCELLAEDAMDFLNDNKITCAFVLDNTRGDRTPVGIVHLHDFLQIGLT